MNLWLLILVLFLSTHAAEAVVPQLWSVMQGVLSFLPQIFLFLVFTISLAFKWSTWKGLFAKWRNRPSLVSATLLGLIAVAVLLAFRLSGPATPTSVSAPLTGWPMLGRNITRTNQAEPGPIEGVEQWRFRERLDRAPFNSSAAIAGNRVYVGSDNYFLYCFDADTGQVLWKFEAMYELFSSPAVADGRVYFGEGLHYVDDALFYCVDAVTGELIWQFQTTSHTESSPTVVDGKVIFGAGEDGVYCLDAVSGEVIWQFPGVHADSAPLVMDGRVYFGSGYGDEGLYCLDFETGQKLWKIPLEVPAWGAPSSVEGRVILGVGNGNFDISDPLDPQGGVICVDALSGEKQWYFEAQDAVLTSVALGAGRAYFGSRDGLFYCVDASSGQEIWRFDAEAPILSSPALTDDRVYFGSNRGRLYTLDTEGKSIWEFDASKSAFNTDARILASPAISDGRLYVGSMNFFFYCLD